MAILSLGMLGLATFAPDVAHSATLRFPKTIRLADPDGAAGDTFGHSVALSGRRAVVGAKFDDDNGEQSGSVFVFDAENGHQISKFVEPPTVYSSAYGRVAVHNSTVVVGAPMNGGTVYKYSTNPPRMNELTGAYSNPEGGWSDFFGSSVAVTSDRIIVGSVFKDEGYYLRDAGAVYSFPLSVGGSIQKFTAPDAIESHYFGGDVAVYKNSMIVGAHGDDDLGEKSGAAYLFDILTGDFVTKLVAPDGQAGAFFGGNVDIFGDYAVVGATLHDNMGAVYVFDTTTGSFLYKLTSPDADIGGQFGSSLAMHEGLLVVGAELHDGAYRDSGAAYIFDVETGSFLNKLTASKETPGARFGSDVDIFEGSVLVGAISEGGTGAAYLFMPPVPVPPALPMAASALGGLFLLRSRRQRQCSTQDEKNTAPIS